MDRLSTELDEKIIRHLVGKEASALSMTSKYYRSLAEPQLYQALTFSAKQYTSLMLLFDTLVDRQDLARHIHSFVLTNTDVPADTTSDFDDMFFLRLWNKFDTFKRIIDGVVPPPSRELTTQWLGRMFVGAPVIDGQLAIILCLAKNLEHLTLVVTRWDRLPVTRAAVFECWIKGRAILTSLSSDGQRPHVHVLSRHTALRADDNTSSYPHSADMNEM